MTQYRIVKSLATQSVRPLSNVMALTTDPSAWPLASNARIAVWRKLSTQKSRERSGQFVAEGVRLVSEALLSGCPIEALLTADDDEGRRAAARALGAVIPSTPLALGRVGSAVRVPRREFSQITDTVHSAGVAAIVQWNPRPHTDLASLRAQHLLFCDRIADPGNLGTLIRTAAGLGLDAVLAGPNSVEMTNPKTIRATAGTIFHIPVFCGIAVTEFVAWCRDHRHTVLIADVRNGRPLDEVALTKPWTLVIGSETGQVDRAWETASPRRIFLPMQRGVESFNAAVAGAIIMDRLISEERRLLV